MRSWVPLNNISFYPVIINCLWSLVYLTSQSQSRFLPSNIINSINSGFFIFFFSKFHNFLHVKEIQNRYLCRHSLYINKILIIVIIIMSFCFHHDPWSSWRDDDWDGAHVNNVFSTAKLTSSAESIYITIYLLFSFDIFFFFAHIN